MTKYYNPLFPTEDTAVKPVVASTTPELKEEANQSQIKVLCGPQGVEIPAWVDPTTRIVTPVLK